MTYFLYFVGFVLALTGLAHAVAIPASAFGLIDVETGWKTAMIAFFLLTAAVEVFTGNITHYAGQLLKAITERISGVSTDS